MSQITTHVLDTALGKPAPGIFVELQKRSDGGWQTIGNGHTNSDGRIADLLDDHTVLEAGNYLIHFALRDYFESKDLPCFYPEANIIFEINDGQHYHIPLLLSPYGYSTYRGS